MRTVPGWFRYFRSQACFFDALALSRKSASHVFSITSPN
jgi:hypothetical protein